MTVLFNAIGQSGGDQNPFFNGQQVTESHTASGGDICVLAGLSYSAANLALGPFVFGTVTLANLTRTVAYNGVQMTSIGVVQWGASGATVNAWTELFALMGAEPGPANVQANVWGGVDSARTLRCETVSYSGVASIGAPVIASGAGTAMALAATVPQGGLLAGVWGTHAGMYIPSGSSVAQRYVSNDTIGLLMGDLPGNGSSQTLTANQQNSNPWGGIVVPLQRADTVFSADPFVAQVPYIAPRFHRNPRIGGLRRHVFTVPTK